MKPARPSMSSNRQIPRRRQRTPRFKTMNENPNSTFTPKTFLPLGVAVAFTFGVGFWLGHNPPWRSHDSLPVVQTSVRSAEAGAGYLAFGAAQKLSVEQIAVR